MANDPSKAIAIKKTAVSVALKGGAVSRRTFIAPWTPKCLKPVSVYRSVRPNSDPAHPGLEVSMKVPCRRCAKCLQIRQMAWRERALSELQASHRSWFVTLTFAPVHLAGILLESASDQKHDREKAIEMAAYRHVQQYFKRLRKAGHVFRFLAVYERGEANGRSHYHLLIHETGRPIAKRSLEEQWRSHVNARLVDTSTTGVASYITKYTTKSLAAAPRASIKYGKPGAPKLSAQQKVLSPPHTHTAPRRPTPSLTTEEEGTSLNSSNDDPSPDKPQ